LMAAWFSTSQSHARSVLSTEGARAIALAPPGQKEALSKLVEGMPEQDRQRVSADYLLKNTALAFQAKAEAPWGAAIPEDIFINYLLPYSVIGEEVDDWRADFRSRFLPVVSGIQKPGEAAQKINTVLWKMLEVVYSPKRDKPDQSPYHSMRIKMASCTGLSILLIDACRSVGIPARFVGCRWVNKPGNHSWVEVWQDDAWYHLGAFDGTGLNEAWFNSDVIYNKPGDPQYAIFAYTWLPSEGTTLRSMTSGHNTPRPALDVTQRYLDLFAKPKACRIQVVVRNAQGIRQVRDVVLMQGDQQIAVGKTFDDTQDLNSHFTFVAPEGVKATIQLRERDGTVREAREVTFEKGPAKMCIFFEK
jgi:hypothetical protein